MDNGLVQEHRNWRFNAAKVLILVVMDNGLVPNAEGRQYINLITVLILVVVEDGLVHLAAKEAASKGNSSLNPCYSGRWSRTIDELKSTLDHHLS